MKNILGAFCALLTLFASFEAKADGAISQADDHAPISVMGDHTHGPGEIMLSYRYMTMEMDENRDGTDNMTPAEVRAQGFMMAPIDMTMDMHMFGGMYGVNKKLTMMGMLPYIIKDMEMENAMLARSKMHSEGFGDIKVTGLYTIYDSGKREDHSRTKIHLTMGMSLPTGSTSERDNGQKLPYSMQLGSGTFDPILGVTYYHSEEDWSYGGQAKSVFHLGENDEGYRLGDEYILTAWAARNLNHNFSASFGVDGKYWDDINGRDGDLNPAMSPTARADLRSGVRVNANLGLNYLYQKGVLKGHRLAVELSMPLYQDLDGPQLKTGHSLMIGWQKAF